MIPKRIPVLLVPLLLAGCLQVEVNGPVTSAEITITPLRSARSPVAGVETRSLRAVSEQYAENWSEWNDRTRLALLGVADLDAGELADDKLYLVTAGGGQDQDANGDGRIDNVPRGLARSMHAIMTGAQLRQPLVRVNLLTEAIYQLVAEELDQISNPQVKRRLSEYARKLVGDVNRDGQRDYEDVLQWSQAGNSPYLGEEILLQRMSRSIYDPFYGAEQIRLDAENLVDAASWFPADRTSPYADLLVGCATPIVVEDLCRFRELPLIGQQAAFPGVDDIMPRLVVSHDWMIGRFRELLQAMPADLLLLFRSVAAVVIGGDVRPAFYSGASATIFLDGDFFWLSAEEQADISTEADFRLEFADQVAFADLWRYVAGNERAYPPADETDLFGSRDFQDVVSRSAVLLFHELAHAADFFRPQFLDRLSPGGTPFETSLPLLSDELLERRPLRSAELAGVGQVLYFGAEPTEAESSYTPRQIGAFFDPDRASDLYAYASPREDLAMLFEEAMMYLHFGFRRDLAFTTVPPEDTVDRVCEDFVVGYGMRGRLATEQVLPRARQVVAGLLPERSYGAELGSLPQPVPLRTDTDWCSSIDLGQPLSARKSLSGSRGLSPDDWRRPYR